MSAGDELAEHEPVGGVVWAGLAIVGGAAAVLSFSALADLAHLCGMVGAFSVGPLRFYLAWLFPLAVDAFAVTATVIWLRRRVSDEAISYARRSAWSAIAATVVGNAYHAYLTSGDGPPGPVPWPVVVVVSAVPPIALGAVVHLAVLVGRPARSAGPVTTASLVRDEHDRWVDRVGRVVVEAPDPSLTGHDSAGQSRVDAAPADADRELTDADRELVTTVCAWAETEDGDVPSRERIRLKFAIGSSRADRLRTAALTAMTAMTGQDRPPDRDGGPT